jgi:hypothetical protein
VAQEQATKIAKMHDSSTSIKSPTSKPSMIDSLRPPSAKKDACGALASNQQLVDQSADLKKKEVADKEVPAILNDPKKMFRVSTSLDPK